MAVTKSTWRKTTRSSTPDRWDLTHLVDHPVQQLETHLATLEATVAEIEAARPKLAPSLSSDDLLALLRLSEAAAQGSSRLSAFAYLWFSENTKDAEVRLFKMRVEERLTALNNRLLFFDLWWQSVDDANAARLMDTSGDFRYHLETIRRYKPHTLSEPEEKIVHLKNVTDRSAVHQLYDVVTNGLTFTIRERGKKKTVNLEGLMAYARSLKSSVRQAAYQELYRVFTAQRDVLGEMYKALVNDWKAENLGLRRFSSAIATRNLSNDDGR